MLRFVLLRHECPVSSGETLGENCVENLGATSSSKPSHWDFMLESEERLRTWDLRQLPAGWAEHLGLPSSESESESEVIALPLPDHRLAYLDFEGPLSGDRGSVRRCDQGTYKFFQETEEKLIVVLTGKFLRGTVQLVREKESWLLALAESKKQEP